MHTGGQITNFIVPWLQVSTCFQFGFISAYVLTIIPTLSSSPTPPKHPPPVHRATHWPQIKGMSSLKHLRFLSTDGFLVPVPACAEILLLGPDYLLKGTHIGPVENVRSTINQEREEKRRKKDCSTGLQYWKCLLSWSNQF